MAFFVYIQIPKTAGVTMQSIVRRQFDSNVLLEIGKMKGKTPYNIFNQMQLDTIHEKYNGVIGHIQFGIHEKIVEPVNYVTMIRDPVRRYLSQYYDVKRKGRNTINHLLQFEGIDPMILDQFREKSFDCFLKSEVGDLFANLQTRYLCQKSFHNPINFHEPINRNDVIRAQTNLKNKFVCFGLVEKFDESLLLFQKILKWKSIYYKKLNVINQDKTIHVSNELHNIIIEKNKYDASLYSYAEKCFNKKIEIYE